MAVASAKVSLPPSELVYEDGLALSDLTLAPKGQMCCLRRKPNQAVVLVWPGEPSEPPAEWTTGRPLSLLSIFAFDGARVFANTGHDLVAIAPESVEVLHSSQALITTPAVSSDGHWLSWIERGPRWKALVAPLRQPQRPTTVSLRGNCLNAVWSENVLVVRETEEKHGVEQETRFFSYVPQGEVTGPILSTRRVIHSLAASAVSSHVFIGAGEFLESESRFAEERRPSKGTWVLRSLIAATPVCIVTEVAGGAQHVLSDRLLFAGAEATVISSTLFCASEFGCAAARVPHAIRDFALSQAEGTIFYREFGPRGGIRKLSIAPLLEAAGSARG